MFFSDPMSPQQNPAPKTYPLNLRDKESALQNQHIENYSFSSVLFISASEFSEDKIWAINL